MGLIDGDYLPKPPTITTSKTVLTARRLTQSGQYSEGYDYYIVVFLSFTDDPSAANGQVGQVVVFTKEEHVVDYSGRDLKGLEIYTNPRQFQANWEPLATSSFEQGHIEKYIVEEYNNLIFTKPLDTIVSELDNEIK